MIRIIYGRINDSSMTTNVNNPSLQKFFLYARKSTDVEDKQILSIEAQLAELRDFAKRENLFVVEEFVEKQSAKIQGRPVFNKMLDSIEKDRASGIVCWHPDRLARNSMDGGKIIYLIDIGKLKSLKCPQFWFEPTPQGKFMLAMAFGQSKYFVDALSENTKRGLRQKVRRGEMPGVAPLGYLNDSRDKSIKVNKKISPLVVKAFEMFATGKYRLYQTADFLAENGVALPSQRCARIDKMNLVLKNPFYYGHFRYLGEIHEGVHKPIITKKLFDEVQEVLNGRSKQWTKARITKPFLGLLKCGECGMAITGEIKNKYYKNGTMDIFKYYRCTRKSKFHSCRQPFIREENLDFQLSTLIKKYSLRNNWASRMLEKLNQEKIKLAQSGHRFVFEKQDEVRKISSKLTILLDSYLDQEVDKESYFTKKSELLSQKKKLEEKIFNFQQTNDSWLGPMKEWIIEAQNSTKVAKSADLQLKKVLAAKIFGSDLFLENRIVRGQGINVWSALRADPTGRTMERVARIELASSDWQPDALPLSYTRDVLRL